MIYDIENILAIVWPGFRKKVGGVDLATLRYFFSLILIRGKKYCSVQLADHARVIMTILVIHPSRNWSIFNYKQGC